MVGAFSLAAVPSPFGPRHWGQLEVFSAAARVKAAAIRRDRDFFMSLLVSVFHLRRVTIKICCMNTLVKDHKKRATYVALFMIVYSV